MAKKALLRDRLASEATLNVWGDLPHGPQEERLKKLYEKPLDVL